MAEWDEAQERRSGMAEITRAVRRLEEASGRTEHRLTRLETGAEHRDEALAEIGNDVKTLMAAHNVSKGMKILGNLGLTTVAGVIGAAVTTWISSR